MLISSLTPTTTSPTIQLLGYICRFSCWFWLCLFSPWPCFSFFLPHPLQLHLWRKAPKWVFTLEVCMLSPSACGFVRYYWVLSSEYIACSWVWILSVKLQCTGERFAATSRSLPIPESCWAFFFIDKQSHFTYVRLPGWSCWYSVWCWRCRYLQLASLLQWGGDGDTQSGGKCVELAVHQCEGYFREPWECFVSFVCKEIGSEGLWFLALITSPGPQANPAGHQT